ncbi:ABC transporter permease [Streptomyces griseomycini]|uniref:Transport permease protein n=1 Tax=Streptomyces griseomycini TaxID=66895 RepID=A0A7W7PX40_9ACTN|nr:ABC transporter permease [Streptomyces griseomycini]MBB4902957.1 ABC-2 type transport system permease protein [Streptomyces griseomycini]GGQ31723.1 transport permease protein [Streptomyces griseomycini]GGR47552.1 transport permease protein [Streptomyces griseomycini]
MTTPLFHAAVLRTEVRLFRREPGNLFWIMLFPSLLLGILGAVPSFREADPSLGGLRAVDAYVPVAVLLGVIVAGVQGMPQTLTGYREHGILRRMATTPVRAAALLSAQMLVFGGAALVSALLALAVGRLAFDVRLPGRPVGYLLALLLAVLACLALGALLSALSRTTKIAAAVGSAALFPAMFCAGVWLPVQAMPDLLADIVGWTPFGAAAEALNDAAAGDWPGWTHLAVTAAWTVLLTAAATRWFRWE